MDHPGNLDTFNYDIHQYHENAPGDAPMFGGYDLNGQPIPSSLPPGTYFGDPSDGHDENDPKRRRIARVRTALLVAVFDAHCL